MKANHVYQYSIINALMAGIADSGVTVSEYLKKGNHGIGTFTEIMGELVLLDDKVYQLEADGVTRMAEPHEQLPYAVATNFVPQWTQRVVLASKELVVDVLRNCARAPNLFLSFRVEGMFASLLCRTVRGQEYEGQSLAELGDRQSVQTYSDIEGVIVGFYTPAAWQGFFVAGLHMHFIDKERKVGGHVMALNTTREVDLSVAIINNIHIELPTSEKFRTAKMSTDNAGLRSIEG